MNEIYGGLVSTPANKKEIYIDGSITRTFGGIVKEHMEQYELTNDTNTDDENDDTTYYPPAPGPDDQIGGGSDFGI